jgi:hypothetical protein
MKLLTLVAISVVLLVPASASAQSRYNTVPCHNSQGYTVLKSKPRQCTMGGRFGYQQAGVYNIRWRSWGGATALGGGTLRGNMGFKARVRFKLYRREHWEENTYLFTRARGTTFMPDGSRRHWTLKLWP